MNPYKLYPKCPKCEKKGPMVEKGVRQCLSSGCKIKLYWRGGVSTESTMSDPKALEKEYHRSKERIMSDALKKHLKK